MIIRSLPTTLQARANTWTATQTFAAITATTITGSGIQSIDDTTDTTSGTTGSIHTDGGLGIAKNLWVAVDARVDGTATLDTVDINAGTLDGVTITSPALAGTTTGTFTIGGTITINAFTLGGTLDANAKVIDNCAQFNFDASGRLLQAADSDSAHFAIMARDTGVALVEVARAQGAANPYFAMGGGQEFQFANNGTAVFGAGAIAYTGTLASTGARVTKIWTVDQDTTNAENVSSWSAVKHDIKAYTKDATAIVRDIAIIEFQHNDDMDPSTRVKLGVRAESIREPLAAPLGDYGEKYGEGPKVDMMGLTALNTKSIQELDERLRKAKL
tara:strand:- start:3300 stop:4289 length:990 start_codon:yes stop_codon:yes gene_type:complete